MYCVTYKQIPMDGSNIKEYGLEIMVFGECIDTVEARLHETIIDMEVHGANFRKIRIERT